MVKNPSANEGDPGDAGLICGFGRSPGGEHGNHASTLDRESHRQRSLAGCNPLSHIDTDKTETTKAAAAAYSKLWFFP